MSLEQYITFLVSYFITYITNPAISHSCTTAACWCLRTHDAKITQMLILTHTYIKSCRLQIWAEIEQQIQASQTCNTVPLRIPTCASITYLQNLQDRSEIYHIVHKKVHGGDGRIALYWIWRVSKSAPYCRSGSRIN